MPIRRVVTGHDKDGKSVVLSDGPPPQNHPMHGTAIGADFFEMWGEPDLVPKLTSIPATEPNDRPFTIMPAAGHLIRIIDIFPPQMGGKRTVMHRTRSGTNHAWENRTDKMARMVFFHVDAQFSEELLAKLPKPLEFMT